MNTIENLGLCISVPFTRTTAHSPFIGHSVQLALDVHVPPLPVIASGRVLTIVKRLDDRTVKIKDCTFGKARWVLVRSMKARAANIWMPYDFGGAGIHVLLEYGRD